MTTYTAEQLQEIVRKHGAWLLSEDEGERADLSDANLHNANLSNADLRDANLRNANLSYANLRDANLHNADLSDANLSNANLSNANLRNANLSNANLRAANLHAANLNWNSRTLLSEILYRAGGGDLGRRALACLIGRNTGWCWAVWLSDDAPEGVDQNNWLGIVVKHRPWALSELAEWVKDGDGAPEIVRRYAATEQPE